MTKSVSFVLSIVAISLALSASAQDKSFYITKTNHQGDTVLTACATGYHFASINEIYDFSGMTYNTELGQTNNDSGFGIPS